MTPLARAGLPDPSGTRIVLIGVGQFSELGSLPAMRNNVDALADLLANAWNLPTRNCTVLRDPASPRDLSRAVEEAAREATDTLLVYYAGHGLTDRAGRYHLAVQSTERESVHDTAVSYSWIKAHIERSRAERRIVILDSCYAARAFGSQSDDAAALEVAGTYILAAASETVRAFSPPEENFSAFTDALLTVLRNGVPGPLRHLDLNGVFDQLSEELERRDRPRPAQLSRDHIGRAPFIMNVAYRPPGEIPQAALPPQRVPTTEPSKSGGEPRVSRRRATVRMGKAPGLPADTSGNKPVPVLRRKIFRYAGLAAAGLALLFGGWSAYAVNSISYEDSPKLQEIRARGFIKVGIKGDQPGLSEMKNKEWVGFEIDLARKIAASLGFTRKSEVEFVVVGTGNRDTALQSGKVDFVVATWTMDGAQADEARTHKSKPLDFVGPYYTASLAALVWKKEGDDEPVKSIADIAKYREEQVCTVTGSTSEDYLNEHNVKAIKRESYRECWKIKKVLVVVTDDIILAGLAEEKNYTNGRVVPLYGTAEDYGVGIRANDPVFKYLTCRAISKDWKLSADDNITEMAKNQLGKDWSLPLVDFPECSKLEVWSYKLRNVI